MTFNEPIFYRKTSDESDDHTNSNDLRGFKPNGTAILIHSAVFRAKWTVVAQDNGGSNMDANTDILIETLFFKIEDIKPVFYLTFMDVFFTLLAGRETDYLDVQRDNLKILSLTNSRNKSTLFFNPFKESDFKVNEFPSTSKI